MPKWSNWIKLAGKGYWIDYKNVYNGPACYELGIGGPDYDNIIPVYVGETKNEKKRISKYVKGESHLSEIINDHLEMDFTLYYRAQAKSSKAEAKKMQDSLLNKFDYDWNIQLNTEEED